MIRVIIRFNRFSVRWEVCDYLTGEIYREDVDRAGCEAYVLSRGSLLHEVVIEAI